MPKDQNAIIDKVCFNHEAWIEKVTVQQYRRVLQYIMRRAAMREIYEAQVQKARDRIAESRELLWKVDKLLKW